MKELATLSLVSLFIVVLLTIMFQCTTTLNTSTCIDYQHIIENPTHEHHEHRDWKIDTIYITIDRPDIVIIDTIH